MTYHTYQSRGFILKSFNLGESNKYFHIFTEDLGLIRASAQNVRALSSKLRFNLQDFAFSHFVLVKGKSFWKITNVSSLKNYYLVFSANREKLEVFAKIFSLIDKMLGEEEENFEMFKTITQAFDFLETGNFEKDMITEFENILVLRIVHIFGYLGLNGGRFSNLLDGSWSVQLLNEARNLKKDIVFEINRSIKESQL